MGRYLRILRRRAAVLPFLAAVVARLPISMGPLGMVVLLQQVRGNYSVAGVVTAAFAVGAAVSAPVWGRLIDRIGQSRVIGPLAAASALLLSGLAVEAVRGAEGAVLVVLAVGVGLTFPPISPAMRAAWRAVLASDVDRRAAYALDAVAVETIFVGGPLLLSLLLGYGSPALPLLVTAALLLVGGVGYALTGAARTAAPAPEPAPDTDTDTDTEGRAAGPGRAGASPLRDGGVLRVLAVAVCMAAGFGLCDLSVAATAREVLGSQARVGLLFAALAGGSACGGLWYGSRAWKGTEHHRLPVVLGGFATGLLATSALLTVRHELPTAALLPVLYLTGLCIAPGLIMLANLVDQHGPADRLGEAQAWLNTAYTAGSALGTGAAGAAVDAGGPARGFGAAAGAVAAACAVSALVMRRWSVTSR